MFYFNLGLDLVVTFLLLTADMAESERYYFMPMPSQAPATQDTEPVAISCLALLPVIRSNLGLGPLRLGHLGYASSNP